MMTYDFHGGWETFTGHNSPLYPRAAETGDQQLLNMVSSASNATTVKSYLIHRSVLNPNAYVL